MTDEQSKQDQQKHEGSPSTTATEEINNKPITAVENNASKEPVIQNLTNKESGDDHEMEDVTILESDQLNDEEARKNSTSNLSNESNLQKNSDDHDLKDVTTNDDTTVTKDRDENNSSSRNNDEGQEEEISENRLKPPIQLPVARIKRIVKQDGEITAISTPAVYAVAAATVSFFFLMLIEYPPNNFFLF